MSEQVMAYRAVCDHGKTHMLIVDEPQVMKDCAEDIADAIKEGLHLERVAVEEARRSQMGCDACDEIRAARKQERRARQKQARTHAGRDPQQTFPEAAGAQQRSSGD